ncbi:M20 family metallo-hydrolase [Breznakibacter xylanolyticus]|nr:M20 family metallo-hydrolase [Breznakibacter xylanolyticus]
MEKNTMAASEAQYIALLKQMISIQSFSRDEKEVADMLEGWFVSRGICPNRKGNNLWMWGSERDAAKPTLLLNSHLDTVKPGNNWTAEPFTPAVDGDKLTGLGSNDAGASVVSLIETFFRLRSVPQAYNLVLAITAEEEVSGLNGVSSILEELGTIDLGIVGEPTGMNMAVAERGLLVLDCYVAGQTGHAARNEGVNAIYKALAAIEWFRNHPFDKATDLLGPVKMSVTMINAGTQHNVVPDKCHMVVDCRINECYSNVEVFEKTRDSVDFEVVPRSFRLNSSNIPLSHSVVKRGLTLGLKPYGSPTSSDMGLMPFTTLKIGPGDSARSHTPDEYILISEIEKGIEIYWQLLNGLELK